MRRALAWTILVSVISVIAVFYGVVIINLYHVKPEAAYATIAAFGCVPVVIWAIVEVCK
jgi:hypothetical protein